MVVPSGTIAKLVVPITQPDPVLTVSFGTYDKMVVYVNKLSTSTYTDPILKILTAADIDNNVDAVHVKYLKNVLLTLGASFDVILKNNLADVKNEKDVKGVKGVNARLIVDDVNEAINNNYKHFVDLVGDYEDSGIRFKYTIYKNISKFDALQGLPTTKIKNTFYCIGSNPEKSLASQLAATRCKRGSTSAIQLIDVPYVESEDMQETEAKLLRENGYTFTLREQDSGDVLIYAYASQIGVAPADIIPYYIEDKIRSAILLFLQTEKPLYNDEGCKRIGIIADNAIGKEIANGLINKTQPTEISFAQQTADDIKKGRVAGVVYRINFQYTIWYVAGEIKGTVEV